MNFKNFNNLNTFSNLNGIDNLFDENYLNNMSEISSENNLNINNSVNLPNIFNMDMNNGNLNLYEPLEGYLRGNLFKDLYDPYKSYRPQRININSEEEELLTSIGEYSFASHDLNLYLDVNPNDQRALNLFNKYREQMNELILKYERKYGPLTISSKESMKIPFSWEVNNWPWEV